MSGFSLLVCIALCSCELPPLLGFIVAPKLDSMSIDSILNARYHMPIKAPIVVLTDARFRVVLEQPHYKYRNIVAAPVSMQVPRTIDQYSSLMLRCSTYDALQAQYILVFQSDSRFCSTSPHRIGEFMNVTYVGAPWVPDRFLDMLKIAQGRVGNGGFSLRQRAAMLAVCADQKTRLPEDVELVRRLHNAKLGPASVSVAENFSAEQYLPLHVTVAPLGIHKPSVAMVRPDDRVRLQKICPETSVIQALFVKQK